MISAEISGRESFAARLAARARKLAQARAETLLRARRNDAWRWRKPGLLWPLFGKETD